MGAVHLSRTFGYALLAAAVTAFWFYPPLGTPWFEQTAFLFHFLASLLLFYGFRLAERKRVWTAVLVGASGWMTGLAFLSKQNAGLLSVAACTAIIVVAAPGGVRTRFRFSGHFLLASRPSGSFRSVAVALLASRQLLDLLLRHPP